MILLLEEIEAARAGKAKTLGQNAGKHPDQKVQLDRLRRSKKVGPMRGRCTRPTKVKTMRRTS